jgi:hypothetical protein
MQKHTFTLGLILVLFMASCASPPQPGAPVTHGTACNAENNDQRVSIEGYPSLSGMTFVSDDFSVDLFEQPQGGGDSISVYLAVGNGANQAEALPDDYTDDDLRIHTSTNQVVSTDTRIRVHGTLTWNEAADVCFISSIDLIEAAPAGE